MPRLDELERRGHRERGARPASGSVPPSCARSSRTRAGLAALHSPNTGVVDFGAVAAAMAADLREAGGTIVTGLRRHGARAAGRTGRGRPRGRADRRRPRRFSAPARGRTGWPWPPVPIPIRASSRSVAPTCGCGPAAADLVRSSIYPVPDPDLPFLGMHLTRDPVRRGAARADRAARRSPRRLPAAPPRPARPAREPRLAGDAADDATPLAHRAGGDPPRGLSVRVVRRRPAAATSPSCGQPTSSAAATPASAPRRSPGTARWSTTS